MAQVIGVGLAVCTAGCNVFDVPLHGGQADGSVAPPECTTSQECTDKATQAAGTLVPSICSKTDQKCVEVLSPDCEVVTGDYTNDKAIFLGSVLTTKGAAAAANIQRQESAILAVQEINDVGGVPGKNNEHRPLVMVSCNSTTDLLRAGRHLIEELHVAGIVGPNLSQDVINLTNEISGAANVVAMSPTSAASSVADLSDNGMTFQMVPNDLQRAPLLIRQINDLETQLKADRAKNTIKLSIIYRDDALGVGTRISLNSLILNGKPISDPTNLNTNVRIDGYNPAMPDQAALVATTLAFEPDIIAIAGTTEAVTQVVTPLEHDWPGGTPRPYYIGHDGTKVPDFVNAVSGNDEFRHRVRGVGTIPPDTSGPVFEAFKLDYVLNYPGKAATISGMGPCYDSVYAMAFALAASKEVDASGVAIVAGFPKLAGGGMTIEIGPTKVLSAFQELSRGASITALGTFGPLAWTTNGSPAGGAISMWCIGIPTSTPIYQEGGLKYDVMLDEFQGTYTQCAP